MSTAFKYFGLRVLLIVGIAVLGVGSSRSQPWQHIARFGSERNDRATRLARDSAGNIYTTGTFRGTFTVGETQLSSPDANSMYLAKFLPDGGLAWATVVGRCTDSTSAIDASAIQVDREGGACIVGRLAGSVIVGKLTRHSVGMSNPFVLRLYPDGSLRWIRIAADSGQGRYYQPTAYDLALDAAENTYVIGSYDEMLDLDTLHLRTDNTNELFVLKLDPDGAVLWGRTADGFGPHWGDAIALNNQGDIVCAGTFFGTINFGGTTIDAGDAEQKIYLMAMNADGGVRWSERIGDGGYYGYCADIAVDERGNAYFINAFHDGITVAGEHYEYFNQKKLALLIVKCDRDGGVVWSRMSGGANQACAAAAIARDRNGMIAITGKFYDEIVFGSDTLLTPSTNSSTFLATLDETGAFKLAVGTAVAQATSGTDVVFREPGSVVLLGQFTDTLHLDDFSIASEGGTDAFMATFPVPTAGVPQTEPQVSQRLFPNPADREIRVNSSTDIVLTDLLGRIVARAIHSDRIETASLPSGTYLLNGQPFVVRH